ncbi:MAG: hypothetical protein Q7U35_08610 [Methanobacteriaceae archaeon]|jgi:hypothetical protein|nr:hypothetical protein [Methanobacteriaceae archaeon]MDP3485048.1 hypothetical protein [Methanobacteriaceae archaeon]MDP3623074.1 hypothetical protein [Methanobacteriaceae archaeon]
MKEYVGRKEFNNLKLELDLLESELLKSLKQPTPFIDGLTKTYNLTDNRSFRGIL